MFKLKSLFNQEEIIIEEDKVITIGKSTDSSIIFDNNAVSDEHSIVYIEDGLLFVTDLGSDNGTFINSLLLEPNKKYQLNLDDVLIIGTDKIQYQVLNINTEYIQDNEYTQIAKTQRHNFIPPKKQYTIGRFSSDDLVLDSPNVSRTHLIVTKVDDSWEVEDNASANGTYLNSFNNRIDKIILERDQTLYLANYKLPTNRIFQLVEGNETVRQKIDFTQNEIILGRTDECDLTIRNPNISSEHAKIIYEDNNYYIIDLDSTNGTFVNFNPIDGKTQIIEGDKITLGAYTFEFFIDREKQNFTLLKSDLGVRVDIKNISYEVYDSSKKKNVLLLDDISLSVYPGEFVGLMGLSGAGKTTLLNVISGYNKATDGSVHINGIELYRNFDIVKQLIGYVPQDDIIHPELSVYESLLYSAKLRLDLSKIEIDERIDEVLKDLGIYDIKDKRIGSADRKGISGGQRRRVNLAVELIADPDLIFLDEPTSGLSSVDTKSVMETLKKLTDNGKTIIITIHQPSLSNYKMMDNIIILTHGQCAYYGQNYPNSIKFFNNDTEDTDILSDADNALIGLDIGEKEKIVWKDIYKNSTVYKEYVEKRINKPNTDDNSRMSRDDSSSIKQFFILSSRYLKVKLKDRLNMGILISQSPLIAILLIVMFFKGFDDSQVDGVGYGVFETSPQILLFIIIISSIWFGMNSSVREIVSEKTIFRKERHLGLKIVPYVLSKFSILFFLSLIQVIMLVLIINYGGVPLKINIAMLILLSFMASLSGVSIGLLLSSLVKTQASALSMLPILLLPMIVLSGGMVSVRDMSPSVHLVSLTMPTRFILEETIREYDSYPDRDNLDYKYTIEPYQDDKNISRAIVDNSLDIFNPLDYIKEYGNTLCQDKRCVEQLYMKIEKDDNITTFEKDGYRVHPNKIVMYAIFLGWILLPLLLTMFVLKRKYRIK
jgi:ABC-type multidrug transport system ATPase subunit/pSer/pThr/pTyr-binding forkhead associated (FHA) protein/ABC-type transport system involved in multi-copper enzyme maturation permease subunit